MSEPIEIRFDTTPTNSVGHPWFGCEGGPELVKFPEGSQIVPSSLPPVMRNNNLFSTGQGITITPPHGDLWEIVRAVAETDSTCYNDNGPSTTCPYCNGYQTDASRFHHNEPFPHEQDCIVLKARRMVETLSKPVAFATQVAEDIAEQAKMQRGSME